MAEMTMQQEMDQAEKYLIHTYNRHKIVLEKGDGVYLYDMDGKNIWILEPELQYSPLDTITRRLTIR